MAAYWFAFHIILLLPASHSYFDNKYEISIITYDVSHIPLSGGKRFAEIIKIQVCLDFPAVKHRHGTPNVPFKHQWGIV